MNTYIYKAKPQAFSIQNIKSFASPITILYGGKSGNSAFIAERMRCQFQTHELEPAVYSMAEYDVNNLVNEKFLFIVVSTRGEGDPPGQAQQFYKYLMGSKAPKLPNLNFSVCALGDSSYKFFCQTGKDIDKQLGILGAKQYIELTTCDLAFNAKAESWASSLLNKFQNRVNGDVVDLKFGNNSVGPTFSVTVKDKFRITGEQSTSEISHLVLQTDHSDFTYQPGDSVSVKPKNPYSLVVSIMIKQDYTPDMIVKYKDKKKSIEELLAVKLELTKLSEEVLRAYQIHTGDENLKELMENKERLYNYLKQADVCDMLCDFPYQIEASELSQILSEIQRREYSISSSVSDTPNEVHLTVKQFNYSAFERDRIGACSSYINKGLQLGSSLKVQLVPNEEFRLPADDLPIIMIGAGTGIAPYISFLKERKAKDASGDNWLIFGEKQKDCDFLYQNEIEVLEDEGILTRLDLAFSRDQAERIYVQDRLKEKGKEVFDWLEKGAHVYICGSIAMGKDVKQKLVGLLQSEGPMDES
ncbi:sulfite reductase flavoprotein subunit alpha, partial [Ancylomarina sp.]|uniref:diflavin oxidoreductase n=1 Tax=Ancylomarina sp. TaxID=1970196 RepID=UPI003566F47F